MNMLFMRNFVIALAVLALVPVAAFSAPSETANPAAWRPRERWRGFNLPGTRDTLDKSCPASRIQAPSAISVSPAASLKYLPHSEHV